MPVESSKKEAQVTVTPRRSSSASGLSIVSPRTPRFTEATSVNSPIEPNTSRRDPFVDPIPIMTHYQPQPQPSDVGFGYIGNNAPDRSSGVEMPSTPRSPLKSAMKSPGAPPRKIEQVLSPTFREEQVIEKEEKKTEKAQAKDLKQKVRVRMAKILLRTTNFSCSLIVLSMLSASFSIFNATKTLPPRNNLPAWSGTTIAWPQITLLVIACISLFASILVFYAYWKGGHRRAEKVAVYYSSFAVVWFVFSIVMWAVGAAVLQHGRTNSNGQDIWGWSCNDNQRKLLFQGDVQYELVCRLQNWSLVCCIIEVVVEVITILIYGTVFYRYYSKRKLRKSMAVRDRARSDLYLAQLRSQSAPNTPGLASPRFGAGPLSPSEGGYNPMFSPRFAGMEKKPTDELSNAEEGGVRYINAPSQPTPTKTFQLQAPPVKNTTPKMQQSGFEMQTRQHQQAPMTFAPASPAPASPALPLQSNPVHAPAAPGEQQYASVPIPGAYASPLQSPQYAPPQGGYFGSLR